jgi:four helix bundle protein
MLERLQNEGKAFRKLIVWQKAALSVPTNIVEGYGRQRKRELRQFVNIALGSLAEVEYYLDFSQRLGYFSDGSYEKLQNMRREVGNLLWRFYKSL